MIQPQLTPQSDVDFVYDTPGSVSGQDAAGLPARVAIFADGDAAREQMAEDLAGAGFRTVNGGTLGDLLDGPITLLGDVVMVDCPVCDGSQLAALARLDMRVARAGAKLIAVTSLDALEDVFAALDQSDPQILVQPSRAERIVAIGRVLADMGSARVREMRDEDRLALLHLSRQVEAIAHRLEGLSDKNSSAARYDASGATPVASVSAIAGPTKVLAPVKSPDAGWALPDAAMVRRIIAARQSRARYFEGELFADPAWDMLLDLTAAHAEDRRVCITSLCIAAAVPATTALRWVSQMVKTGIFERVADPADRRRAFISLSTSSRDAMARYFAEVEAPMAKAA